MGRRLLFHTGAWDLRWVGSVFTQGPLDGGLEGGGCREACRYDYGLGDWGILGRGPRKGRGLMTVVCIFGLVPSLPGVMSRVQAGDHIISISASSRNVS